MKCRYEGTGVWAERCLGTKEVDPCPGYEKCNRYKPDGLTNGDRIRAMSDEELSKFIPDWSYTNACKCDEHYVDCNTECENCVLEWLKQPAEGGLT